MKAGRRILLRPFVCFARQPVTPQVWALKAFKNSPVNLLFFRLELAFKHMVDQHSFDFVAVKKQLALDTYGGIRMINYLRAATKKGLASADSTDQLLKTASEWTRLDEYLKPFMMDDALIFGMHESDGLFSDDENEEKNSDKVTKAQLEAKILSLQDTVATLAQQLR